MSPADKLRNHPSLIVDKEDHVWREGGCMEIKELGDKLREGLLIYNVSSWKLGLERTELRKTVGIDFMYVSYLYCIGVILALICASFFSENRNLCSNLSFSFPKKTLHDFAEEWSQFTNWHRWPLHKVYIVYIS